MASSPAPWTRPAGPCSRDPRALRVRSGAAAERRAEGGAAHGPDCDSGRGGAGPVAPLAWPEATARLTAERTRADTCVEQAPALGVAAANPPAREYARLRLFKVFSRSILRIPDAVDPSHKG